MGRKTQITKEIILDAALQLLIRQGYAAINIKSIAAEVGCSTQPIAWHFENMDSFRRAFLDHCIRCAKERFTVQDGPLDEMLERTASNYVRIAHKMPHLFRFVFVDNKDECKNSDIIQSLQLDNTEKIVELLCREKGLTEAQAASFLMDFEFYIHGIASYTMSGFCNYTEEEIICMVNKAKDAFLAAARNGEKAD